MAYRSRVGIRQTTHAPMQPKVKTAPAAHNDCRSYQTARKTIASIRLVEKHLTFRDRLWCISQSRTIGPNRRCCSSQEWSCGDAFAKHAAAKRTNGVVGRPGSTTPRTASASAVQPTDTSSHFLIRPVFGFGIRSAISEQTNLLRRGAEPPPPFARRRLTQPNRKTGGPCDFELV